MKTNIYTKKKHIKYKKTLNKTLNKTLKGGKYLGQGSYGCVVSPAIPCNTLNYKSQKLHKNLTKSVSKIIISPDDDINEEINISSKLKQLDPKQHYFITFEDKCFIKNIPSDRSNTARVEYYNDSREQYRIINNTGNKYGKNTKKYDKEYCGIDLRLKPINLIMPYGGYNLLNILDKKNTNPHITLTLRMLVTHFRSCFKHLLIGIKKMHDARIVNRDIKNENILVNYNDTKQNKTQNKTQNKIQNKIQNKTQNKKNQEHIHLSNERENIDIRFIDFGLSTILTHEHCKRMYNIDFRGTMGLVSPDLLIIDLIKDNISNGKIKQNINTNIKDILYTFKYHVLIINFDKLIFELYQKIKNDIKNNTILTNFFGTETNKYNGYLQKGDIYALAITIYEFYTIYKHDFKNSKIDDSKLHNIKLFNLLQNMLQIDPDKRYNILQCLKHPYFA